jgi:kinesin family protein 3/17
LRNTFWIKIVHTDPKGVPQIKKAKLNLVDLAGSERHGKTGISTNSGLAFNESKSINLSLSTLGKVIQCLSADKPSHIPYRESKLTRILQDSLGGNARTLMIACLSPTDTNHEESLSTLKYAHNAKFIKNRPVINDNIDPKDEIIMGLQNEIKQLRNKLNE